MDFQNRNNEDKKFVCPSDRQLALRAKLRTGWSCTKVSEPLAADEQAAIISVIRRNEDIESAERIRIGRLVERVEKIKQRATDRGPNSCRLCGQNFGLLLGLSRLVCEDCQKPVCSKCSIDVNIKSQTKAREIWLCRICSETREMWKKSGAWFFKGLPDYEIPTDDNKMPTAAAAAIGAPPMSHVVTKKAISSRKFSLHANSSSSSDDDDAKEVDYERSELNFAPKMQREDSFRLKMVGSFRNFFETERKFSGNHRQPTKSESSQQDWDCISTVSVAAVNRRESSAHTRQGSISSSVSVSESSSGNGSNANNPIATACREPLLGWLELLVTYSEPNHTLECNIIRARDLPAMDSAGLTDPFCKLNIITPEGYVKYTRWSKTKTVHKTRNPEFNECVTFLGVEPEELGNSILYVVVRDDDKYGHDFLGAVRLPLLNVYNGSNHRITAPLGEEDQYSSESETSGPWPRGKILISLCYNSKKRGLLVVIKQCMNLIPMDNNGSSDPFVKLQLKPDVHKKKCKTTIKWKNLNPTYNEEFLFESSPHDLHKQSLIVTIWDKDIGKSNDFLGSLVLGHNSKGERLKQWLDCVRIPDYFHEKWHFLNGDNPL